MTSEAKLPTVIAHWFYDPEDRQVVGPGDFIHRLQWSGTVEGGLNVSLARLQDLGDAWRHEGDVVIHMHQMADRINPERKRMRVFYTDERGALIVMGSFPMIDGAPGEGDVEYLVAVDYVRRLLKAPSLSFTRA